MAAVSVCEMRLAENSAIANGWSEEQLLDLAGIRLGHAIGRFYPNAGTVIGYLGKGHNAGDTLVALRILRDLYGWEIAIRNAFAIEDCAPLTQQKWRNLDSLPALDLPPARSEIANPLLLLDGLLGTGSVGALGGPLLALAEEMNALRQTAGARVAAVDLPTGIDADSGACNLGAVTADVTFMIGNAKRGLLLGHAANYTGALALVPVEVLAVEGAGDLEIIAPQTMDFAKCHRPFDFHKGMAGRVAIIAGSAQYSGAAVLAAVGALRGGGGLITLFVPVSTTDRIASKCPPEIMVRGYSSFNELTQINCDALVVGCGIGELETHAEDALLNVIRSSHAPCVIDADALNLIAKRNQVGILNDRHVITPHPGEFQRLAPDLVNSPRESAARTFVNRVPACLLLKGSRSVITQKSQPLWCNSTGSPGMATGGQGDLLAGVIGARLAIGDAPLEAAALSAWLCGRSAEISLNDPEISEESLTPCDVANHLGAAFRDWKTSQR
ncbi:MAG: NAD(P)H-hydrate dehydratase [Gloeobacteraceae cyanobacterium ES-bin-144]|nr:NAD(P)H-hydrate dehydratase [Verrucomicrobiales bacterium]